MSVSVERMADEIAKMLTEYEAAIVKNVAASGCGQGCKTTAADQPQKNGQIRQKLGRDKRR